MLYEITITPAQAAAAAHVLEHAINECLKDREFAADGSRFRPTDVSGAIFVMDALGLADRIVIRS